MFKTYTIRAFVEKTLKQNDFLIHRLENLDFMPPSSIQSPHKHLFYELIILEEGHSVQNVDFETYHLRDNQLFFINPNLVHHWEKNLSKELRGYRILFTEEFLQQYLTSSNFLFELVHQIRHTPLLNVENETKFLSYAQLLLTEFLEENSSIESLRALLFLLLNEIKRIAIKQSNIKIDNNSQLKYYISFISLVEQHYNKNLVLDDYAKMINLSTRQLSRLVKQYSNETLNTFVLKRKILQSKRLLRYSDLSIAEIAYEIGFKEVSYFCKVFKKYSKQTPLEFKRQIDF